MGGKTRIERSLALECLEKIGQEVILQGWVQVVRAHGKIAFVDLRDRSGVIQVGAFEGDLPLQFAQLHSQDVIQVVGHVKARGEKFTNKNIPTGTIEIEAQKLEVIQKAQEMPFDMGGRDLNLELPTLLDFRSLTLRHETVRKIFIVQAKLAEEFRNAAQKLGCIEVFVPTIAAGATEGGSEVFQLDYFGHKAFMTQSPQLYKQIMVSVFERVFTIAKAYRAEPSVTTRHLTEATQMDVEIGFIKDFEELLDALEFVGSSMIKNVSEKCSQILKDFQVEKPLVSGTIPRLTLREAQKIVEERTNRNLSREMDLNPEDEIEICKWAHQTHQSDFVTITHFPTKKRAFYTLPDPENPEYSLSYDLLFKGLEILSGSQRISDPEKLREAMVKKDVNPESFKIYLQAFQYGMPPEGGFSFGLERLTMKLLDLHNVREASLFPRDMERVDERFASLHEKKVL